MIHKMLHETYKRIGASLTLCVRIAKLPRETKVTLTREKLAALGFDLAPSIADARELRVIVLLP
jgi:hypothetical protein